MKVRSIGLLRGLAATTALGGAATIGLLPLVTASSIASAAPTKSVSADEGPHGVAFTLLSRGSTAKPFDVHAGGVELEAKRAIDVAVVHVTLDPRGATEWHVHAGPVVVTVTAGAVTHVDRNCRRHTYNMGQSFIEEGPGDLAIVRNLGRTTAEVVAAFFAPTGTNPLTIPAPAPPCAGSH